VKTPVQLWLPLFYGSPFDGSFSRDLQRAQDEFKNEQRIFLLPDAKEPLHFKIQDENMPLPQRMCIIPSEEFNVIDILHINEAGNCYPPKSEFTPDEWEGKIPENLFKDFLDSQFGIFLSKKELEVVIPELVEGKIEFIVRTIYTKPNPIIQSNNIGDRTVDLKYPPKGKKLIEVISPESEMRDLYKPANWMKDPIKYLADIQSKSQGKAPETLPEDFPLSIDEDGNIGIGIYYGYSSQPLKRMFPLGGGMDFTHA